MDDKDNAPHDLQVTMLKLLDLHPKKEAGFVLAYTMGLWFHDNPEEMPSLLEVIEAAMSDPGEE